MIGDDYADVAEFELGDNVLDILDGNRIHAGKWLVKEDELRIDGKRAGNLAAAAFSSGELDAERLAYLGEVELVYQGFEPVVAILARHPLHLHHREDVVLNAHLAKDGSILRKIAYALLGTLVHRKAGDFLVIEEHSSLIRHDLAGNHIETCCLSGTVRSQEADDLALVNFHRDALYDCSQAVFLNKVFAT